MEMEMKLGPRLKSLPYKIKAMSRETAAQKASHILDPDLRNYWSAGTNTKEWILLELHEPCLLSHVRIHNKSVLEWEVTAGLRYKPEVFVKVRPRCEAPRRDMSYSTNYTPARYVRISCLRGSPIAIFFVQLIGITMPHLEPEFQPVINHLLPQIISHEQDSCDLHLQLLQDIIDSLHGFLPQLESELTNFAEAPEVGLRFLAMLAGPFNSILQVISQREVKSSSIGSFDSEASRNSLSCSAFTVSSMFEPRRSHTSSPTTSTAAAFHPDTVFMLLRKAYRESDLATVCKKAARVYHHLKVPNSAEVSVANSEIISSTKEEAPKLGGLSDYSGLFGEDLSLPVDEWDSSFSNILDLAAVEEGILHVLYACACEPFVCHKLAESTSDFWLALPLIQALLPALRPLSSPPAAKDNTFSQWMQPLVQQALSKIVLTLSSQAFHPLLHACAGYLSSFSPSHAKTACVLIDLCSGVLEPWMPQVISKIDLAMELLEDLLGVVQSDQHPSIHARSAILYIILALSGYMDDLMAKLKEVKHSILFLVVMLERFLQPVFSLAQPMIDLRNASEPFLTSEEHACAVALNVIRTAVRKSSILPYLELEWRRGSVPPSVILSVLDPHMQLPAGIDFCKCPVTGAEEGTSTNSMATHAVGLSSVKYNGQVDGGDITNLTDKIDISRDASLFFAPAELKTLLLEKYPITAVPNTSSSNANLIPKKNLSAAHLPMDVKLCNLQVDYAQLLNYEDCKLRASEFRRMAFDLHLQNDISVDAHNAAIDALLLSAECYINPFIMLSSAEASKIYNQLKLNECHVAKKLEIVELKKVLGNNVCNMETIAQLERKRDKVFIQILLQAAQMEKSYRKEVSEGEQIDNLPCNDEESADAITLVRRNQELLCNFLIKQLQKGQHSMHETLIQSLVFYLHSATKLCCAPESVIDIILGSVENLNKLLVSMFQQHKEGSLQLTPETLYRIERRWELLQSLIIASSGGGRRLNRRKSFHGLQYGNLLPPLAWLQKIPAFSFSPFPLVRYLGWMAVSRNANLYLEERLFLATDLSQLTHLLSIYSDDLAMVSESINNHSVKSQQSEATRAKERQDPQERGEDLAFAVLYPDESFFFPNMHKEFRAFGEIILRAVALQLKSVASTAIPEILCWLSDLCISPFHEKVDKVTAKGNYNPSKGCHAKNARAVILFVLEAIVTQHMEAIIPEVPRLLQLLGSICRRPYSDVSFLHSVLALLKPIIVYSLHLVSEEEKLLDDDSSCNFESVCFDELFTHVRKKFETDAETRGVKVALVIFVLSSFAQDLSFVHKRDLMLSSLEWVDFAVTEPTASFHDYLCAFDQLLEGCKTLFVENLRNLGVIPVPHSGSVFTDSLGNNSDSLSWFPDNFCYSKPVTDKSENNKLKSYQVLMPEEITELSTVLESLVLKLNVSVESCWKLHQQLSRKLAFSSAQCLVYSRYLFSVVHNLPSMADSDKESAAVPTCEDLLLISWNLSFESLAKNANAILEKCCWEVASAFIDCLLRVPTLCGLHNVVVLLYSAIKHIMNFAPRIAWRLQTDRWLCSLFSKGMLMNECGTSLIDLLSEMLSHPEPEQRLIALRHLSQLMGLDVNDGYIVFTSLSFDKLARHNRVLSVSESVILRLVSSTWDQLTVMASSETSLPLRTIALALLVQYIPFVECHQLQAFLTTTDTLLLGFDISACRMAEGLLMKLLLSLIAGIFLYSPAEVTSFIPANVWKYVESVATSKAGTLGDAEKRICQALCKVRAEGNDAKEALKEVLLKCPEEHLDPNFCSTRDAIFQVVSNLTSVQAYFDVFDDEADKKTMELEEAELEMDIIQNEHESYADSDSDSHKKDADEDRLKQIKDSICSVERSRLREEIIARRQKKLLLMRTRQKHLEEAALREAELLQELDRQRILESEREVERQRSLELERAKTNELRYNLNLEKEKQTQRELQRELEHLDSGVRGARREFSSVHSRPRDRYKEKDGVKSGGDSSSRASTSSVQPEVSINNSTITSVPTILLSGQRTLSSQLPTILQTRDHVDEYEENIDLGDTGSTGDPELGSAFDSHVGGFGSSQRHVSRGVKSRQAVERRERDGRREGKWERKH